LVQRPATAGHAFVMTTTRTVLTRQKQHGRWQFSLRSLLLCLTTIAQALGVVTQTTCAQELFVWFVVLTPFWVMLLLWKVSIAQIRVCLRYSYCVTLGCLVATLLARRDFQGDVEPGVLAFGFIVTAWVTVVVWVFWGFREIGSFASKRPAGHSPNR
jgi:hypothetical protein